MKNRTLLLLALSALFCLLTACQTAPSAPSSPVYTGAVLILHSPSAAGVDNSGDQGGNEATRATKVDADPEKVGEGVAAARRTGIGDAAEQLLEQDDDEQLLEQNLESDGDR